MKHINLNQRLQALQLILSVFGGLVRIRDCAGLFPTRGRQLPTRSVRLAPQRNRQRLQRPDDGGRRAGRHLWLRPPGLHSSKITCQKTRNEHTRLRNTLQEDPALPGELCVYFVQGEVTFPGCGLYWILDTDYENYASVYSCVDGDILGVRSVFAWLLTREQIPSQETVK